VHTSLDCSFASSLRTASSRLQKDGCASVLDCAWVFMGATSVQRNRSTRTDNEVSLFKRTTLKKRARI
jgi:hypothetical protein